MEIVVTIKEVLDCGNFGKFCEITGLNPWCLNEGLADGSEKYTLTPEQAKECSLMTKYWGVG